MPVSRLPLVALCLAATANAQTPLLDIVGDASTGFAFGSSVAAIGDVNRDGVNDFVVGLPFYKNSIGAIRVHSGRDGRVLGHFEGDTAVRAQFGKSVGAAGDVNRDGYPDILASGPVHPKSGNYAGYMQVVSGKDGTRLQTQYGLGTGDLFGTSVNGVGDIDKDGHADYIVGAPENADPVHSYGNGYACLFSGKDGKLLHTFKGYELTSEFGHTTAAAGDVDKDGVPDLLIGSLLETEGRGSARLFSGRTKKVIWNFPAEPGGDHFGMALDGAGDVDGDGYLDVLVGAPNPYSPLRLGTVWVFSGRTGKTIHKIVGSPRNVMIGLSVRGIGDVNNDGFADFAAGDPSDATASKGRGSIRGFSGKDGSQLFIVYGRGGMFGATFAVMGDHNRDGMTELLTSAPGESRGANRVGVVSLRSTRAVAKIGTGCSVTRAPELDVTEPHIGKPTSLFVRGTGSTSGVLFMSALPELPIAVGSCLVHLDLGSLLPVSTFRTDASGRFAAALVVPNQAALVDATFALQGAMGRTPAPLGADLTNGVHVTVGR